MKNVNALTKEVREKYPTATYARISLAIQGYKSGLPQEVKKFIVKLLAKAHNEQINNVLNS